MFNKQNYTPEIPQCKPSGNISSFDVHNSKKKPLRFAWQDALTRSDLSFTTRSVMLFLSLKLNDDGTMYRPISMSELASIAGCTRRTVINAIKDAREKGFLLVEPTFYKSGDRAENDYTVLIPKDAEVVKEIHHHNNQSLKREVVNKVHQGSELYSPGVVNDVHTLTKHNKTNKTEEKEKINKKEKIQTEAEPASLPPKVESSDSTPSPEKPKANKAAQERLHKIKIISEDYFSKTGREADAFMPDGKKLNQVGRRIDSLLKQGYNGEHFASLNHWAGKVMKNDAVHESVKIRAKFSNLFSTKYFNQNLEDAKNSSRSV